MKIQSEVFLKDDLHNILRSLATIAPDGEYGAGFRAALVAVATATGMEQAPARSPEEDWAKVFAAGWEGLGPGSFGAFA